MRGGRSGLDYLREWCELATTFDIATGYFDIGALLSLGGHWQKLEGMRVVMGDELTRTQRGPSLRSPEHRRDDQR